MVAVVTGVSLGLERASIWSPGSPGRSGPAALGRSREGGGVNAVTGDLVISRTDEMLFGHGPGAVIVRTDNSLGAFTDERGGGRIEELDDSADDGQVTSSATAVGLALAYNALGLVGRLATEPARVCRRSAYGSCSPPWCGCGG